MSLAHTLSAVSLGFLFIPGAHAADFISPQSLNALSTAAQQGLPLGPASEQINAARSAAELEHLRGEGG